MSEFKINQNKLIANGFEVEFGHEIDKAEYHDRVTRIKPVAFQVRPSGILSCCTIVIRQNELQQILESVQSGCSKTDGVR